MGSWGNKKLTVKHHDMALFVSVDMKRPVGNMDIKTLSHNMTYKYNQNVK